MKGLRAFRISTGRNPEPLPSDAEEIVLGESGRGRCQIIIPISGTGEFIRLKRTGDDDIVAVRFDAEKQAPAPCVCAINACGAYSRGADYRVPATDGLEEVATGHYAFGAAGRTGGGEHVLAICQSGVTFKLRSKYNAQWYTWNGETWLTESLSDHDARLALAEVEAGGGEWL